MAPVRRRRVWNFSIEAFSASESSAARKRRKLIHSVVRRHVFERHRAVRDLLNKEIESSRQIHGALGWQQLRFAPPSTLEQSLRREELLQTLLTEKLQSLTTMLQLYGKIERHHIAQSVEKERLYRTMCDDKRDSCVMENADNTVPPMVPTRHSFFVEAHQGDARRGATDTTQDCATSSESPSSPNMLSAGGILTAGGFIPPPCDQSIVDSGICDLDTVTRDIEREVLWRQRFATEVARFLNEMETFDRLNEQKAVTEQPD